MKRLAKMYLKAFIISLFCFVIFVSAGFIYLTNKIKEPVAKNDVSSVPYSASPENAGVLLNFAGDPVFLYLDFEAEEIGVIYPERSAQESTEIYGYSIDYSIEADYALVSYMVDSVNGIEMAYDSEQLSFTGEQVAELLSNTADTNQLKRDITEKIINKIALYGFLRQDFLYIIENTKTDLTVPDCYYWAENLQKLCKNMRIID